MIFHECLPSNIRRNSAIALPKDENHQTKTISKIMNSSKSHQKDKKYLHG